ncbi:hypothetical protein JOC33_004109 [Thalassobacillus pellis]|nr:hypothetical protein [Thalassobacillus pellis]
MDDRTYTFAEACSKQFGGDKGASTSILHSHQGESRAFIM